MSPRLSSVPLLLALAGVSAAGCNNGGATPITGSCQTTSALSCNTVLAGNPDAGVPLDLVGYACTGDSRPDLNSTFISGIPQGQVCADEGDLGDGTRGYCCTPQDEDSLTTCAYDPARSDTCPEGYAYSCRGANRPEVFNPAVTCGNGVREGSLIRYCCHAEGRPVGCTESKGAAQCTGGLTGWVCPQGYRPRGEDYGANESRSDYYYFVCGVPSVAPSLTYNLYCCFIPKPLLPGASCVYSPDAAKVDPVSGASQLPGCTSGRFAFACYGRDTPDQDYYPRLSCTEPPVSGTSDDGYAANLYCCDYVPPS